MFHFMLMLLIAAFWLMVFFITAGFLTDSQVPGFANVSLWLFGLCLASVPFLILWTGITLVLP